MDAVVRLLRSALLAALLAGTALAQTTLSQDDLCAVFKGPACVSTTTQGPPSVATPATTTQEQLCEIFKGPACGSQQGSGTDSGTDSGSGSTTARPAEEEEIPGLYDSCPCPDEVAAEPADKGPSGTSRCECVMFYQCDNTTGAYNTDGKGLINIRKKDGCQAPETRCCLVRSPGKRSPTPHPNWPTPTPLPAEQHCGMRNENGVILKIQDSQDGEAEFGELPWMVAILETGRRNGAADKFIGGGSIIKDNVVLTAAHIVKKLLQPDRVKVRAGEWDRESTTELLPHQDRVVSRVVMHDKYHDRGGNIRYDVALLILESPLMMVGTVGSICLPEPGDGSAFNGRDCLVSGWGQDKLVNSWPHRFLKRVELRMVPRDECEAKLQGTALGATFQLNESFVCAGGTQDRDSCKGDGGGPLACPIGNGRYELAGAVSWGVSCGMHEQPGLYANVALVRPWIDEVLATL